MNNSNSSNSSIEDMRVIMNHLDKYVTYIRFINCVINNTTLFNLKDERLKYLIFCRFFKQSSYLAELHINCSIVVIMTYNLGL